MRIIIAGAGAVGRHLAKLLTSDRHDIVVINEDASRGEVLADYDLQVIEGQPTQVGVLETAGVAHADLFIGVTPRESDNILACCIAKGVGAQKTVARVDNYEFTRTEYAEHFKRMGVDSVIFPEQLAAQEIIHGLQRSWVRQWWEIHEDLFMLGIKVRASAPIVGKQLRDVCKPEVPYMVAVVKRNGETLIPRGDEMLLDGDVAYFLTTRNHIAEIKSITGKEDYGKIRNLIIMGGSTTAIQLLRQLDDNIHVKVIDQDGQRCAHLMDACQRKNTMYLQGDGRDMQLLSEEAFSGERNTQAFLALTGNAEQNILACIAAKRSGYRKTVAMIESLDYVNMAESFDIGTIINKKRIAAAHIYHMLLSKDVNNVKSLVIAQADVAEFKVHPGSPITRCPVRELSIPSTINLGALVRDGQTILINGNTHIQAGDLVTVFCLQHALTTAEHLFEAPTQLLDNAVTAVRSKAGSLIAGLARWANKAPHTP
ncbi:MAG: Trk system potassium transporter TrkA [Bacteroidales bacterium]|nr:Trk system potassium transporter TrkA [Bacteroidales bacterium]